MTTDDMELVRQYATQGCESAFAALVSRHANLVYSASLRLVGDPSLAQEVGQAVFILLAQKAASLDKKTILPSWLYRTACYVAMSVRKREHRRQLLEQEAYMQSTLDENQPDAAWQQMAPLLEEAMLRLSQTDRDALVLRFFEGCSLNEVGTTLGTSEEAAKKRVNRALGKVRQFFIRRGVVATSALIAGTLSANSVQAAPLALVNTFTAVAVAKGAAAEGSSLALAKAALNLMAWAKVKTAIVLSAYALLAAGIPVLAIYGIEKPVEGLPKGWSVLEGTAEQWHWADGKIIAHSTTFETILASTQTYSDFTLSAVASTTNREASLAFRMQDALNGYRLIFAPLGDVVLTGNTAYGNGLISLRKTTLGVETDLGTYQGRAFSSIGPSARIAIVATGPWLKVLLNDLTVLRIKDVTYSSGRIGLRIYGDDGAHPCDATFSDLSFSGTTTVSPKH